VTPLDATLLSSRVVLEYEVGNVEEGQFYLDRLLELMRITPPVATWEHAYPAMVIPIVSRGTGLSERLDIAQTAGDAVFASPVATPHILMWPRVGFGLLGRYTAATLWPLPSSMPRWSLWPAARPA